MYEYKIRKKCAICENTELQTIINYGNVPLAGFFPKKEELDNINKYNLALQYCPQCNLLQTNSTINSNILFKDYRYMSSISLQNHFNIYAKYLIEKFSLNSDSKVLEIGSNDGVLLKPLMDLGINVIGIDPSKNISKYAINRGCNVIVDFFNIENAKKYFKENEFNLITASNTFAHVDDIHSMVKGIHYSLKEDGHFIFEVHYGKNIIEGLQYDNVYHEHIYYYTIHALIELFKRHNMQVIHVDEIALHSGSIRVIVLNNKAQLNINNNLNEILIIENNLGLNNFEYFKNFSKNVYLHKSNLLNTIIELKNSGNKIGAYGASGRANILCNFVGIDDKLVDYIIDESPERNGRYINNIPILDKDKIDKNTNYIIIFAWNYSKMIISKLENTGYKFKFIIPFPKIRIVESFEEIKNENTL